MKILFLDSNIFLSFFSFASEDLDQLGKLIDLIKRKEIKLFVTTQVTDEFKRNREFKIKESYNEFAKSTPFLKMPPICKSYSQYSKICRTQSLLDKQKSELNDQLILDIREHKLKADLLIDELFDVSEIIDTSKFFDKAISRYRVGNPPGKKDKTCGDELNWEAILKHVSNANDFILVSNDGDYSSAMDEDSLSDFLKNEWMETKGSNIYFYKNLTKFFTEHDIKIQLRIEEEKNELIESLINSGSFLSTHEIIRRLSKFNSYSDEHIKGLGTALLGNSQVGWISLDPDVNEFYKNVIYGNEDLFDEAQMKQIDDLLCEEKVGEIIEQKQQGVPKVPEMMPKEDEVKDVIKNIPF